MVRQADKWIIDLQGACTSRGIRNAHQLWLKIGGSKGTAAQLWAGSTVMIKLETLNRLQNDVGISPFEYLRNARGE